MMAGQDSWRPVNAKLMTLLFYYLTEDSSNIKEQNEVEYLSAIGRVVVVRRGSSSVLNGDSSIKNLIFPNQSRAVVSIYFLWTKICYLLGRSTNSLTDKNFPVRNVYTGNTLARWLINSLWPVKYTSLINRFLPFYEDIYFSPFRFSRVFVRDKCRSNKRFQRVIVHDSLILRLTRFTPFILMARRCGFRTFANVKSWDNPFYTQFIRGADGYLTWSSSMWSDVQRFHKISTSAHHIWGPRPFYNFARAVQLTACKPNIQSDTVVIGYAAAFCDTLMASHEVNVVADIAKHLLANGIDAKILFRPYPIVPISLYKTLQKYPNVRLVNIKGASSDRYGDGREIIRLGSDEERIEYMSQCHCFLSIGTSFTFEAALFGLPIIQYFIPQKDRNTKDELVLFERLDISDHILSYFLPYLPVAKDLATLVDFIKSIGTDSALRQQSLKMLAVIGFPPHKNEWNVGLDRFISDMRLG